MEYSLNKKKHFLLGLRDGIPIGIGYIAVSFALGINAREAGMNAFEGFVMSVFNHASAGEYAGIMSIAGQVTLLETALVIFVANMRYLLMSCALSQRLEPNMPLSHRLMMGFGLTDEIFAAAIGRPGYAHPCYTYGLMTVAIPMWAAGTALGILAGNILPGRVVSALSVALFGMFLAVIIPEARKDRVVLGLVVLSFGISFLLSRLPVTANISEGMRVIVITVALSALAAIFFPVKDEETPANGENGEGGNAGA